MKRLTFITLALLAIVGRVCAQESVSVKGITVPQGGEAFLEINYSLEGAGPYVGFMFLPFPGWALPPQLQALLLLPRRQNPQSTAIVAC